MAAAPLRYLFALLFLGTVGHAWHSARDQRWTRPSGTRQWASVGAGTLLFLAFTFIWTQMIGASRVPDGAVELEFPFREGVFEVVQGGSRPMMNGHMAVRDMPLFRGQTWALDIVQLDRIGRRARGIYPRDLERYQIFGTPVVAPCAGRITAAENERPDFQPPDREPDIADAPGNFVQIACEEGFYVLLAHLRQGSLIVTVGDSVTVGDVLGTIGNSGNTTEPHLHINAQSGSGDEFFLDADPLPIVFRGHGFLKRNDRVRVGR
jgi:hypothetical protein